MEADPAAAEHRRQGWLTPIKEQPERGTTTSNDLRRAGNMPFGMQQPGQKTCNYFNAFVDISVQYLPDPGTSAPVCEFSIWHGF